MVPQNCIIEYTIADKFIKFIEETIKNWKLELTGVGKSLTEVKIL